MSNTFKSIDQSDINYVETELNRLYSFSDTTDDSLGIAVYSGISGSSRDYAWTGSGQSNGLENRLIWTLANKLIFEGNKTNDGTIPMDQATTPGVSMSVMCLPPHIIGDGIKPGSIVLTDSNLNETYTDTILAGRYGQIWSASTALATVDYDRGIIAVTDQDHVDIFGNYTMLLRNRMPIRSYEVTCRVKSNEFLMTLNPTAMSGSLTESTYIPAAFTTNSAWSPYITTVGLYNSQGELVVIGKFSQPIKKPYQYDLNIVTRFDI